MNENVNQQQLFSNSLAPNNNVAPSELIPLTNKTSDGEEGDISAIPTILEWPTTLISQICREGNMDLIRAFVEYSKQTISCGKNAAELADRLEIDTGLAPLHHAARYQHLNICVVLLSNIEFRLGVNIKDVDGRTPIHSAFRSANNTNLSNSKSEKPLEPIDFGSKIQDSEAWQEEFTTKILSSHHPLIYLFARANGNINARDKYLLTPLHYAVARNNLAGVKQLIELNADVQAQDRQGIRPIHVACKEGYLSIAEYLIEHGAKVDVVDADKWTLLHHACAKGHLDIIKLIKSKDYINFQKFIQAKTNTGATCLHLAVQHGNTQSVVYILEELMNDALKILVNVQVEPFGTSLHIAAKFCDPSMIDLLYHYGADPLILNSQKQSALHIACIANRLPMVQKLLSLTQQSLLEIKDNHGQTVLSVTTNSSIVNKLLTSGADMSSLDNNDMNAVMIAVSKIQLSIVEHLLFCINEPLRNILDQTTKRNNRTIFLLAVQTGSIEMCNLLLTHPHVRWDTIDKQRMNAFHIAVQNDHPQLIEFLSEKLKSNKLMSSISRSYSRITSADQMKNTQSLSTLQFYIDAQNEDGKTPLHMAAEQGHTLCVESLLKYDADALLPDYLGQIALHMAIQNGHDQCVDLLLKASTRNLADFYSALSRKQSPLITACQHGFATIVQLLLSQNIGTGCETTAISTNNYNTTNVVEEENPLEIAIQYRHVETINVLLEHSQIDQWLMSIRKTKNYIHQTPLRDMIRHIPECANHAFDKFIVKTNEIDHNGNVFEKITYRYQYIDDYFINDGKLYAPHGRHLYRNHPFIIALDSEHYSLLEHPLARQLMLLKWKLYRRNFYITRILTFLLLLVLTFYNLIVPAPNMNSSSAVYLSFVKHLILPMQWIIVALAAMNLFLICSEIVRYRGLRVPFAQLVGIVSYLTSIIAFLPYKDTNQIISWQWQLAALSTLLQWCNVALILRSFPFIGDFIVMFQSILINFVLLIFVTLPLLVAFTFGIKMIFFNRAAFLSVLPSMHKLSAMLIGEFGFETLFFSKPTSIMAVFLFIPFIVVMTIVSMNLLLGLTIGDLQVCMENARAKSNAYRIRELLYIEATLPSTKWLKSNIIESETTDNFSKDSILKNYDENENDTNDNNEPLLNHQSLSEQGKLLDMLNILCKQAKQILETEISLENTLKQLLSTKKVHD